MWAEFERRRQELWTEATQILQRGVEMGEFRPELDTTVAMLGIIGATAWVHRWYQPGEREPDAIADELATLVVEGVRRRDA
jgi:TetR/AcrR family transcriptional regulator, cholesterol catabolism regulator